MPCGGIKTTCKLIINAVFSLNFQLNYRIPSNIPSALMHYYNFPCYSMTDRKIVIGNHPKIGEKIFIKDDREMVDKLVASQHIRFSYSSWNFKLFNYKYLTILYVY